MLDWLDKIRKKSLSHRRLVAFSITLLFTGILFVLWLTIWLPGATSQKDVSQNDNSFQSPKDTFAENFSSIWSGIADQYAQLQNAIKNIDISQNLSSDTHYQSTSTPLTFATTTTQVEATSTTTATTTAH